MASVLGGSLPRKRAKTLPRARPALYTGWRLVQVPAHLRVPSSGGVSSPSAHPRRSNRAEVRSGGATMSHKLYVGGIGFSPTSEGLPPHFPPPATPRPARI